MNPRFVLKVSTRITLTMVIFCGLGCILWLIDEVLRWNILPDFIDIYLELILGVMAAFTGLSILASIVSLLGIIGEWIAQKAAFREIKISRRFKLGAVLALVGLVLLNFVFHSISSMRQEQREAEEAKRQAQEYNSATQTLDSSLSVHMQRVEARLTAHLSDTSAWRNAELAELLYSLKQSSPYSPTVEILTKAPAPYQYAILKLASRNGKPLTDVSYLLSMPDKAEDQFAADIFSQGSSSEKPGGSSAFFRPYAPHAWKLIAQDEKQVGILMLRKN